MLTSVFRIRYNHDTFASLTTAESHIVRLVGADAFKGAEMASSWEPLLVWAQDEYGDDRPRILGDFASFITGCLVMSEQAARGLSSYLDGRGEFLDLRGDTDLMAWNCTWIIDALELTRTRGTKYPGSDKHMRISRYAMRASAVLGEHIFKVPERPGADIFVSAAFVDTVNELGLTGLRFEPVDVVDTAITRNQGATTSGGA